MQIKTSQLLHNSNFVLKALLGYFATPILQIKYFATASQLKLKFEKTLQRLRS